MSGDLLSLAHAPASEVSLSWGGSRGVPYEATCAESGPPRSVLPSGDGVAVVGARVDDLVIGVDLEPGPVVDEWFLLCGSAASGSQIAGVEIPLPGFWTEGQDGPEDGKTGLLLRKLSPGVIVFQNGDVRGRIDEQKRGGTLLEVTVGASYLARAPLASAVAYVRRIGEALGAVTSLNLRRLDLCADVAGWDVGDYSSNAWVKRSRSKVAAFTELDHTGRDRIHGGCGSPVTGFSVSMGGPLMARVYDKRAELANQSPHKTSLEEAIWKAHGWSGEGPVTRVEFQMRTAVLKTFDLRDPEAVEASLDALWQYLTRVWLRFVVVDSSTRSTRREVDPRWALLQRVIFRHEANPARRAYLRKGASAKHALGGALSFFASRGLDFGRVALARGLDGECGELRQYLEAWLSEGASLLAAELEAQHGPGGALDYLHERAGAATHRAACAGMLREETLTRADRASARLLELLKEESDG